MARESRNAVALDDGTGNEGSDGEGDGTRRQSPTGGMAFAGVIRVVLRTAIRAALVLVAAIVIVAGILFARLSAGPMEIPQAADFVATAITDTISDAIPDSGGTPTLRIKSVAIALPEESVRDPRRGHAQNLQTAGIELRLAKATVHMPEVGAPAGGAPVSAAKVAVRTGLSGLLRLLRSGIGMGGTGSFVGALTAEGVRIDGRILGPGATAYAFDAIKADYSYAPSGNGEQSGLHIAATGVLQGEGQNGSLTLEADGWIQAGPEGEALGDLRIITRDMGLDALVAYWPPGMAGNAREWIAENIASISGENARIDRIEANLRLDAGSRQQGSVGSNEENNEGTEGNADADRLALDMEFAFSELETTYIDGMSPLRGAAGHGHLTLDQLHLQLYRGHVVPAEGKRVTLDGSSLVFTDLLGDPAPLAEVALITEGDLDAVLTLIDEEPLALVRKLMLNRGPGSASKSGLDMGELRGEARVGARLVFPLLWDLPLADIYVAADAAVSDMRTSFSLAGGEVPGDVHIGAERLTISGTAREMTVSGEVQVLENGVDGEHTGTSLALEWTERYGEGAGHREVRAKGRVTHDALAQVGLEIPGFKSGSALADFTLRQQGEPESDFDLAADLNGVELALPWLGWSKAPEKEGTLTLSGRIGDGTDFRVDLKAGGLNAEGHISLNRNGELRAAALDQFHLPERAELAIDLTRKESGLEAELHGRYLNLESALEFSDGENKADSEPLTARFRISEIRLSDAHRLHEAEGLLRRTGQMLSVDASGRMGQAALTLKYDTVKSEKTGTAPGHLTVHSQQAGELVEHLGLYEGARGGTLDLTANTWAGENADDGGEKGSDLSGLIKMSGVQLTRGERLQTLLINGRFVREQVAEVQDGLVFESIRVPFAYANGAFTLGQSFAKSPILAITARGEVAPEAGQIDLTGVISPIYGLTSPVENIPLLGQILTGDEGEGFLGMTFRMTGSPDDPQVEVNPLSLLTPGILRGIFP